MSTARRTRRGTPPNPVESGAPKPASGAEGPLDPYERAREICLIQLSHGPRTAVQLARVLTRKGIDDEVAEQILGRLTEVGLIDDEAFARAWVQSRHTGRGLARRALAHELRTRGVDQGVIAVAVADLDPEQELATARALAIKRLASTQGLETAARYRRVASVLARKGYSEAVAYRVIREALEAEGP
ncbi:MAG: regulatory protein RecX [Sporichthyaceae bacterium]